MRAKPRAILKRAFGAFGPLNCIIPMPIRAARFEDAQQIAEVHVASWQVAYRGILSDSLLDSLSVEAWTEQWQERLSRVGETTNLVLALGESLIGLAAVGPARDLDCDPLRTQEVYAIYLRSEYWSQGHGKELYLATEDQMRRRGAFDAVLWVLRDNLRARRFYEAQGFTLDRSRPEQNHDGDPSLVEVRYRKVL
jgi:ribosomal protein S18 acetylase RimI-like enzyme